MSSVVAVISRRAIVDNYNQMKMLAPKSKVLAVLKANAYGHGAVAMARQLMAANADGLGVARLEEALELREAGITTPILLLEGFVKPSDIELLIAHNLETVVHSLEQVAMLEQCQAIGSLQVWLKIDTGMNRLGLSPSEFEPACQRLTAAAIVAAPINFISHFACADEVDSNFTQVQSQLFFDLVNGHNGQLSIANSAAILAWPDSHLDWVRTGISLYGCSAIEGKTGQDYGLRPVMTLKTKVIAIKSITKGQRVGYGSTWQAPDDRQLAVIAIGYGDGYPRHAKTGTPVLINGRRYPIVGRVSMDMITVDLGQDSKISCGDDVTLWGEGLPAEEIAQWADTISYEIMIKLTHRVEIMFEN